MDELTACNCHFDQNAYFCADCIEICGFSAVDIHAPLETPCSRCKLPTDCWLTVRNNEPT